ncbi:hypothetical protein D1114_20875 [Cereibacter sphaeroides]|uniref:Uncharacterized protein n=2 Tax=Cereibacter sphaeroides TaxID=1063 RepID=A0AAX1UFC3_CERSP|nr:hypothetical protein D1114_20875 [Cereibacter sphaeroides]
MSTVESRLSRLEGSIALQQWAVGVVSAVLIGAMAILVAIQLSLAAKVDALSSEVDALPDQINANLQQLVSTLSEAITAKGSGQPPTVIVVPGVAAPVQPEVRPEE